jgi:hypothetical protein
MGAKRVVMTFAAAMLLGCQPPPQSQSADAASEPLDPFVVMIDAERWGVIIDKALAGIREAPGIDDAYLENEMYRADVALKSGAANLIELRNEACVKGLVAGADCELMDWPAWVLQPPNDKTPIEEIDVRSEWLSREMDRFTAAGCEAGRSATNDRQFCDVE